MGSTSSDLEATAGVLVSSRPGTAGTGQLAPPDPNRPNCFCLGLFIIDIDRRVRLAQVLTYHH
jgi:hypothetical protein